MDFKTRCLKASDPALPVGMDELLRLDERLGAAAASDEPVLFARGQLPVRPGIAVVGTRHPTQDALEFTQKLVAELGREGYAIWSGGARGIDAAAHRGALKSHTSTVVVLPSCVDVPYPPEHRSLFDRVIEQRGALLSLWPDSTPLHRSFFLRRNKVLAALTRATVVVEAPCRSGARSTAKAARTLGRPLCVVPHPPWSGKGAGCAAEIGLGAHPVSSASQIVAQIRRPGPGSPIVCSEKFSPAQRRANPCSNGARNSSENQEINLLNQTFNEQEKLVFEQLSTAPTHIDELCLNTGQDLPTVTQGLLTLTLQAVVVEGPAGYYRRRRG